MVTRINRAAWRRIKERMAEPKTITVWKGATYGATSHLAELMSEAYQKFARELSALCDDRFRELKLVEMCKCVARTTTWGLHEMWERVLAACRAGWSGDTEKELVAFELRRRYPQLFA